MGRVADHRGAVRSLAGPALATALAFAILVALGVWQVERLHWKEGLLASIAQGEAAPPVPLAEAPTPFSKVELAGTLRDVGYYGIDVRVTPAGEQEGAFRLGVVERPGSLPVLVNEGWVPDGTPLDGAPRPARIVGYVLPPTPPGAFTPKGDAGTKHFYAEDPASVGAVLGLPRLAPFVVVALGDAVPGVFPQPAQHLPEPPNNHFQYALTWFALAAALLVVFATYARGKVRAA